MKIHSDSIENQSKTGPAASVADAQAIQKAIMEKAYELYERAGRVDGHDVEHWLAAEQMILSEEKADASFVPKRESSENKLLASLPRARSWK